MSYGDQLGGSQDAMGLFLWLWGASGGGVGVWVCVGDRVGVEKSRTLQGTINSLCLRRWDKLSILCSFLGGGRRLKFQLRF